MKHLKIFEEFANSEYRRCTRVNVREAHKYIEKYRYDNFTQFEIEYIENGIFKKLEMTDRLKKNPYPTKPDFYICGQIEDPYCSRNGIPNPKLITGLEIVKLSDEWFLVDFHVTLRGSGTQGVFKYVVDGLDGLDELYYVYLDIDKEIREKNGDVWAPQG